MMGSPFSYHSSSHRPAVPPPSISTSSSMAAARNASQSPRQSPYNPAAYQGGPGMRRPSVSPMRGDHELYESGASSQYNPQEYGPVSGNGGAFTPSRPGDSAPPPPYSPPSRNAGGLHVNPIPHRRNESNPASPANSSAQPTPRTGGLMSSFMSSSTANTTPLSSGDSGWRGYGSPSYMQQSFPAAVMSSGGGGQGTPPSTSRNSSVPARTVPPPPPGPPPPAGSRSASVSAGPSRSGGGVPPPPPGPPPSNAGSSSRLGSSALRRSLTDVKAALSRPRSTSSPFGGHKVDSSAPPAVPPVPPKRKIEEEEGSYRERQRASPKQIEEENKLREQEGGNTNNPWRNGLSSRVSPPRLVPPEQHHRTGLEAEKSPLIDLQSPTANHRDSRESLFRRKPQSSTPPPMVTSHATGSLPQQLPTPPPQQSSPTSPPDEMLERPFPSMAGPAAGPSVRRDNGKAPAENEDGFLGQTRRRYREMLQAEDAALGDADKLRHFLTFLTKECQLRTELYTSTAGAADVRKLKTLIAVLTDAPEESSPSLTPVSPNHAARGADDEDMVMTDQPMGIGRRRSRDNGNGGWWGHSGPAFEQRLRDIEESSRGRTSSRWWETSAEGGSVSENMAVRSDGLGDDDVSYGYGPRRSARYSKTPRASLREIAEFMTSPRNSTQVAAPNPHDPSSFVGHAAYPPDRKAQSQSRSRSRPAHSRTRRQVKTSLDIAPLLTLLPPFPKDYPAINNSHPQLEVFRNLVRTLNQLDNLKALHTQFASWSAEQKEVYNASATKRRNSQAERIQALYASPQRRSIDYKAVEKLNLAFESAEQSHRAAALQAEFDGFSRVVVDPAHRDLHERITAASAAYVDIVALIENPPAPTPASDSSDTPEPPELLEKLTALKWMFDVREQLHKHVFELLSQRNERYKAVVMAPLDDPRDAEDFFHRDEAARIEGFERARAERHAAFGALVEAHVTRGVENALSNYWDIAPLVSESLAKVPADLVNVVPIVPPEEFHQHPELLDQPLVYLQRKLKLARDALYSFVETQTELLCLLHGVKSLRADRGEEERLTTDLKEKVGMIEDEWREGLGVAFDAVRRRVDAEVDRVAVVTAAARA